MMSDHTAILQNNMVMAFDVDHIEELDLDALADHEALDNGEEKDQSSTDEESDENTRFRPAEVGSDEEDDDMDKMHNDFVEYGYDALYLEINWMSVPFDVPIM
jgi:hypothetical protein